ncbi:hypothetical protein [Actinophytocola sp.]|uniref:hypothetical protein n=1 Tax=Actinophytocola sp. TaxID=1872138 RepID=UPI003D6AADB8
MRASRVRNYGTGALRIVRVDGDVVSDTIFENLGNSHVDGTVGYGDDNVYDGSDRDGNVLEDDALTPDEPHVRR